MTLPLFERARKNAARVAIRDASGSFTYGELLAAADRVAGTLAASCESAGTRSLQGQSVAFLVEPSFAWVAVQWGVWRAGGAALPLCLSQPPPELAYTLSDARATVAVASPTYAERLRPLVEEHGLPFFITENLITTETQVELPEVEKVDAAMILYTSGTTGQPKGAVISHGNVQAQVEALVEAWGWSAADAIVEFLPLHHTHGIVNVVTCALWSGARLDCLEKFDAGEIWRRIARGELTLLMAVPTIYRRLVAAWEAETAERRAVWSAAAARLRLMVSGSAALPVPLFERWREITGHVLLERYGMTEIGMALSNPLDGERRAGTVGRPLPGVEVRLVGDGTATLPDDALPDDHSGPGEVQVRGPGVFQGYLGREAVTRASFTADGWFKTGDVAVRDDGIYRLLGRSSVDIIKTGGEKVSALEIEAVLREHPAIGECAVVGTADEDWGECVSAAVVLAATDAELTLGELRGWGRERLARFKVPRALRVVDDLPRNAMGKVLKKEVAKLF